MPSRAAFGCATLLLGVAVGCAPAGPTATASTATTGSATAAPATGAPSLATSPTPVASAPATLAPRPAGALAWPTTFDVEFEPGTYFSSPPFAIPFTIVVDAPGWYSGHLNEQFFDLLRFDGVAHTGLPTRMVAFGVPGHFRGSAGDVPIDGLTAETAADLIEDASYRTTSGRQAIEVVGLDGVVLDIHSELDNTPIFGGATGNFGLSPERDARMAILQRDDGFLIVAVLAEADDLDAAWEQAQGLLETIEFVA
jgi:hypothetical protein